MSNLSGSPSAFPDGGRSCDFSPSDSPGLYSPSASFGLRSPSASLGFAFVALCCSELSEESLAFQARLRSLWAQKYGFYLGLRILRRFKGVFWVSMRFTHGNPLSLMLYTFTGLFSPKPLLPKPPSPRSVLSKSATTLKATFSIFIRTS